MESIGTDLATSCLGKLIDKAIKESRYVSCFTSIAEDFEKKKEELKAKWETVELHVKEANGRAQVIKPDVILWQKQVDELIEQEDSQTNMKCCFGMCPTPNCKTRYSKGKDMTNKIEEMKRLIEMEKDFGSVGLPPNLSNVKNYSLENYIHLESRELKYRELLNALADDDTYMVGLHGMGGTGKTTLAKKVADELKDRKQFDHVIVTTVSSTPNVKKIQDDIAARIGFKFNNCSESERPSSLWNKLTGGEKILLILDDVWHHINFEEIGIPSHDKRKGCKFLLTTRYRRVCHSMECKRIIELDVLSEEEAWVLFRKHAEITDSFSKPLLRKGREIAKECKGLPVAIAAIASSLKGKQQKEEWDVALKSLQERNPGYGVDGSLVSVYKCLGYSYDNLNSDEAKRLFLLCSVFPEDEQISFEILTRFGIGAGLFGEDHNTYEDARIQVAVIVYELINSCLLLKDDEGYVKMHDLIRDAALWIANNKILSISLSKNDKKLSTQKEQNIKYLSCKCNDMDVFSCKFDGSKLDILIAYTELDRDVEVPNSFFDNMKGLRVLRLSDNTRNDQKKSLSLSHSIQLLTNIRSLFIERFKLGDVSFIGTLHSLETLELYECDIDELAIEITELKKLRLLRLEDCEINKNDSILEVIERCSSLEELYVTGSFNLFGAPQRGYFPALQRYFISEKYDIINYSKSKYVKLEEIDALSSERTFKYLVQNTEYVSLTEIEGNWRNLIPDIVPVNNGMNDIVELRLKGWSKLHCLIDTRQNANRNVFSKLTTLKLTEMEDLEELCSGPFPPDFLKSLEVLHIDECSLLGSILCKSELNLCCLKSVTLSSCPKLISLFQLSTSRSLELLEKLDIHDCEELKSIIADEEIVDGEDDILRRGTMFPNLKTLDVRECPQLRFVFHFFSPGDFPKLEDIYIENCDKLEYFFVPYKHELDDHHGIKSITLESLKSMRLKWLRKFIDIFRECVHPKHLLKYLSVKRSFAKDGSTSKGETESVHFKCNVLSWTHQKRKKLKYESLDHKISSFQKSVECFSRQSQILRNVKEISLFGISKIKCVFTLFDARALLVETLSIKRCDELKHIIDIGDELDDRRRGDDIFPKLKHLNVEACEKLKYIFGYNQRHNDSIHLPLPALESLCFNELPNLEDICPYKHCITAPSLNRFELSKCSHFIIESTIDFCFQPEPRVLDGIDTEGGGSRENTKQVIFLEYFKVHDDLHMTCLFKGVNNSNITPEYLKELQIGRCEKLEVIFSTSISRSLPHLYILKITDCENLKYIIEEDKVNNQKISSKKCFPKLQAIVIMKCNQLKCIFPATTELPKLEILMITEARMVEGVFKCQQSVPFELPNLKIVILVKLPNLIIQEDVQWPKQRFVQDCPQLQMNNSTLTWDDVRHFMWREFCGTPLYNISYEISSSRYSWSTSSEIARPHVSIEAEYNQLANDDIESNKLASLETESPNANEEFKNELPIGKPCVNEQLLGENTNVISITHANNKPIERSVEEGITSTTNAQSLKEIEGQSMEESTTSKKIDIKNNAEEGSTANSNESTKLQTNLESNNSSMGPLITSEGEKHPHEFGGGQIDMPSSVLNVTDTEPPSTKDVAPEITGTHVSMGAEYNQRANDDIESNKLVSLETESPNANTSPLDMPLHKTLSLEELKNEQQLLIGETNITSITPHANKPIEISVEEGITSTTNAQCLKEIEGRSMEESTTPKKIECGNGQIEMSSSVLNVTVVEPPSIKDVDTQVTFTKSDDPDDAFMRVSSTIEKLFSANDGIGVSESKPSPTNTITFPVASKSLLVPFEENTSQMVDGSSFAYLVTRELEQLVSNKHLASENLSLLINFLMKHPALHLINNTLSNRYKGYAYSCLAELLKFLRTHSVLDVLGSDHSEFVELLQDVRRFPFDKDWLDSVEKRALCPGLQVSQDAMKKVLDTKQKATKEVEMLSLKIDILSQHLEDLKHQLVSSKTVLESINQEESQILEAWTALHAPIGY